MRVERTQHVQRLLLDDVDLAPGTVVIVRRPGTDEVA